MAGLIKKTILDEQKLQGSLEIPNFQIASRLKIQVDSFLTASTILETEWKVWGIYTGYTYAFLFLTKIRKTQIWPSGVLNYSNENDHWTTTPLSHISLMPQCYFFFTSINYNNEKKKKNSFKEENNLSRKEVWLRCMSIHEWYDIPRQTLIVPKKSSDKII